MGAFHFVSKVQFFVFEVQKKKEIRFLTLEFIHLFWREINLPTKDY